MSSIKSCQSVITPSGNKAYFLGPDLSYGKLPAAFYFALSGEDSLTLDPYNQPAVALASPDLRVFSLTLPAHEEGQNPNHAIAKWAEALVQGKDVVREFIQKTIQTVNELIEMGYLDPERLGVMGLSRGGFLAMHLAAADPRFHTVVGFAPATRISALKEFASIQEAHAWDLNHLIGNLTRTTLRVYMGNRDVLVSTEACFSFLMALTEAAYQSGLRSPPIEFVMTPSIGHQGHGTSPQAFTDGAEWMRSRLAKAASIRSDPPIK